MDMILKIEKIKNRGVLFTFNTPEWDVKAYLIQGRKHNFIIDTGLGSSCVKPIKEYINSDTKPIIVINTHYHWDHIWGNGSLRECTIIASKLCRDMIESEWDNMIGKNGRYCDGAVEMCLPNLVFDKELYFPEDKVRLLYTPGHTIDSISVIDEIDKVIHVGDNVGDSAEEIIPSIYCQKDLYIDTLLKYKELDFDTCISGHNVVLNKDVINKILDLL